MHLRALLWVAVGGLLCAGCSDDGDRPVPVPVAATAAPATSSSTPAGSPFAGTTPTAGPTVVAPINSATTATVIAGGFGLGGASYSGDYGVDVPSGVATLVAANLGAPLGINTPNAPNQVTVVRYYGGTPPAYYTPQDVQEVDAAGPGTPRYAAIVAKHVVEVLRRSGATHVNLAGGSFGGLITRYVIEHDLEGLASSGRIVRWLTVEGALAGSYLASHMTTDPVRLQLITQAAGINLGAADIDDLRTGTYAYLRQVFNTPDSKRSRSPLFRSIVVGHHVSTDDDLGSRLLSLASRRPNDGVLLVEDQFLTQIDARPLGPAVVRTTTGHHTAGRDPSTMALIANFLRSRRRVRIRLLDAEVRSFPEGVLFGRGEVTFDTDITSPEAQREWGLTAPLSASKERHGTAPLVEVDPGDTVHVGATVFDWFVAPGERFLQLDVRAHELDQNLWYRVTEHLSRKREFMDGGSVQLPVDAIGTTTHTVDTPSFRVTVEVRVLQE